MMHFGGPNTVDEDDASRLFVTFCRTRGRGSGTAATKDRLEKYTWAAKTQDRIRANVHAALEE